MRFCHLLPLFYLIRHVQFSRRVSKDGECLRAGPSPLGDVTGGRALRACVALLWPQLLKQKIHLQCFEGRGRAIAEISQWGLSDAPLPQSEWPVWQPPVHIAPENAHTSRKDVLLDVLKVLELWQPTSSIFQDHLRYKNISMWNVPYHKHYMDSMTWDTSPHEMVNLWFISDVSLFRNNQALPLKSIMFWPSNKRDQRRQSPVSWA